MKYINEKGNSLITVLLISLVFTTIGLAIVASSISGTKRVETRESDISITYQSKKVIDEMISEMANKLEPTNFPLSNQKAGSDAYDTGLSTIVISPTIEAILSNPSYKDSISCLSVIDLSSPSMTSFPSSKACPSTTYAEDTTVPLDRNLDFTRVLEIVLVTNNPNETEGEITRTLKKRIILSPLPSFLKYAVGSDSDRDKEGLFINGSPNIRGNIYANQLNISDRANYQLRDGSEQEVAALPPSITGDIYSNTANILPTLVKKNFYKGDIPSLNHDSQFINIYYDETIVQRMNTMLENSDLLRDISINDVQDIEDKENQEKTYFISQLQQTITNSVTNKESNSNTIEKVTDQTTPSSVTGDTIKNLSNSFKIESNDTPLNFGQTVKINGDTVITSTNYPIELEEDLIVNGDLYLVSSKELKLDKNIYVSGDLHLINFDGGMNVFGNIFTAGDVTIESVADNSTDLSNGITIEGDILAGNEMNIRPLNTTISLNSNIISLGSFNMNGDEKEEDSGENDIIKINSVVYTLKDAFVSNINIVGLPFEDENSNSKLKTGQLILLAKKDLTITRMNEYSHFNPMKESGFPYLPSEEKVIQPLKAFFYTEKSAELYGVGSLFYIKGGIFARESLIINAIRANQTFSDIKRVPGSSEGMLSRFIVDYDQDVLLQGIDTLPLVDRLQIIPDEFVIE